MYNSIFKHRWPI